MTCRVPSRRGLSLVELLITLAVMSILVAMALPSLNPKVTQQLEAAAHVLAGDLEFARSLAVANNSRYRVSFDAQQAAYVLEHTGDNTMLDTLPPLAYAQPDDPPQKRTIRLASLPFLARTDLKIVGAWEVGSEAVPTSHVQFEPTGQTTAAGPTIVWLRSPWAGGAYYVFVRIDPVTGVAAPGAVSRSVPGWVAASP